MKDVDYALVELTNAAIAARGLLADSGGKYLAAKAAAKITKDLLGPISAATQVIWKAVKVGDVVKVLVDGKVLGPDTVTSINLDTSCVVLRKKIGFNIGAAQLIAHEEPSTEC